MKKLIVGLLLAILLVVSFGVFTIVTDTYDEDVNYYVNVQLYELYFEEDLEVALDEIEYAFTEIANTFDEDAYVIENENFDSEVQATIELVLDLQDRLTMIEIDNIDVQGAHDHLINGVAYYQYGIDKMYTSYLESDYSLFQESSEDLSAAYEQIVYWEDLLLGIDSDLDTDVEDDIESDIQADPVSES